MLNDCRHDTRSVIDTHAPARDARDSLPPEMFASLARPVAPAHVSRVPRTRARRPSRASSRASRADVDVGTPAPADDRARRASSILAPSRRDALALALCASIPPPRAAVAAPAPPGVSRVTLKTASITPDAAADYLVQALGLTRVDDPAAAEKGRAVVRGAYGITLELRGGGDESDGADEDPEPADPPALASLVVGSDNPARARNAALRAGANPAKFAPAAGERCSGDAFLGCAVSLVGFPVVFVKTSAAKGAPAIIRVGISSEDAAGAARALGDEVAVAANGAQPGATERAAEDPATIPRGTILAPANAGGGGALEFAGSGGGSNAWRVLSVKTGGGRSYARG